MALVAFAPLLSNAEEEEKENTQDRVAFPLRDWWRHRIVVWAAVGGE